MSLTRKVARDQTPHWEPIVGSTLIVLAVAMTLVAPLLGVNPGPLGLAGLIVALSGLISVIAAAFRGVRKEPGDEA
jgi:hypothetical protein